MSKHHRQWNSLTYENLTNEGRGQGERENYKPWIRIQDFASRGTVSRVYSFKTGRIHHFLSNSERYYFYLLEWSDQVLDIREQFPLADIQCSMEIAASAGIRYPVDSISGFPYIMTCDFMVTTKSGLKARTVKLSSELSNQRVVEKLEIERRYWKKHNIDWKLVTENEITQPKAKNLEWLRVGAPSYCKNIIKQQNVLLDVIKEQYEETDLSIVAITNGIDLKYGLPSGTGLVLFKQLVATKQLQFDIEHTLQLNTPRTKAVV